MNVTLPLLLGGPLVAAAIASWLLRSMPRAVYAISLVFSLFAIGVAVWGHVAHEADPFRCALAAAVALVGFVAVIVAPTVLLPGTLVLLAAQLVSIVTSEAVLLVASWVAATVLAAFLTARHGGLRRVWAAWMLVGYGTLGVLALGIAVDWMHSHLAGPAVPETLDLVALADSARRFGWRDGDGVYLGLILAACATRLPLLPLHGWAGALHAESPPPVAMVTASGGAASAVVLLVDAGLLHAPQALRSVSAALAIGACVQLTWGALLALAQRDAFRLGAHFSLSLAAIALGALASLTPQGLDAVPLVALAHVVAIPLSTLVVSALHVRLGHRHLDGWGGLARRAPLFAVAAGAAWLGAAGLPGGATFPASVLGLAAMTANHPLAALGAALAWVVLCAAALDAFRRAFLGDPAQASVAPATRAERVAIALLLAPALVLALAPLLVLPAARTDRAPRLEGVAQERVWP